MHYYFKRLDGLRGLAVLMVFLSHSSYYGKTYFVNFTGWGKFGVTLFFLLSSFLLTNQIVQAIKNGFFNKKFICIWYLKRFLRIYPLFFLYLLMSVLTTYSIYKLFNFQNMVGLPHTLKIVEALKILFLMDSTGILWSVIVEFKFYILLPVIISIFYTTLKKNLIITMIVIVVLIDQLGPEYIPENNQFQLIVYMPVFLMGSICAILYQDFFLEEKIINIIGKFAAILILLSIPSIRDSSGLISLHDFNKNLIFQSLIGMSIILYLIFNNNTIIHKFFENNFLRKLGNVSYGFYLYHYPVIRILSDLFNDNGLDKNIFFGLTAFIITFTMSIVSFRFFESFFLRIVKFKK